MRSEYFLSTMRVMSTSFFFGSRGRLMSFTTPTVTPEIFTGFPSASPETLSRRTVYSCFRAKIFCSEPMKKSPTMKMTPAKATRKPTRSVLSFDFGAIESSVRTSSGHRYISGARRLRGNHSAGLEEFAQHGVVGVARLLHRPHPLEDPAVEKGDAVAHRERRLDVVGDHDRGD